MRRFRLLLASTVLAVAATSAPVRAADEPPCDCVADFDLLTERLEANYVGLALGYPTAASRAGYLATKAALRRLADGAGDPNCLFVLRRLTDWFGDGHLFLQAAPQIDADEAARLAAAAERIARSESEIRAELTRNLAQLDPIEGIWYSSEGYRVGIVRDAKPERRDFVAVMLSEDVPGWAPGQVKAEFSSAGAGSYRAVLYVADHSARYPIVGTPDAAGINARIYRNVLLRMAPRAWGKEFPLRSDEIGSLDPQDPKAPTLRRIEPDTVVLAMPSHSPEYRGRLEALIATARDHLLASSTLIVDLRGNEGGSSQTSDPLRPFLASKQKRPGTSPDDWRPVVLASPDNLRYFRQLSSQGWLPKDLLSRLEAHPGEIVPFWDPGMPVPEASAEPELPELPKPAHVAIVVDRGVVSAGEAFLLAVRASTKVTLFGDNSGGVIDYQNVSMVDLACPRRGLLFGYPMYAASASLPAGGINGVGVAPDVRIGPEVADPIRFVIDYYAARPAE